MDTIDPSWNPADRRKPDLAAPAPKTSEGKPDLTGIWVVASGKYLANIAVDGVEVPFRPEAAALYKKRRETNSVGRPTERCLPHSVPDAALVGYPFKIIQTPAQLVVLFEPAGSRRNATAPRATTNARTATGFRDFVRGSFRTATK